MCPSERSIDPALWTDRVVSGRYYYDAEETGGAGPGSATGTGGVADPHDPLRKAVLNLDVDGWFSLNVASLAWTGADKRTTHWIVRLAPAGPNAWKGVIRDFIPGLHLSLRVGITVPPASASATTVTLHLSCPPLFERWLTFAKRYDHFRPLDLQFDRTLENETAYTSVFPLAHPNNPGAAGYPPGDEELDVPIVYERAGFRVTLRDLGAPISYASAVDKVWNDDELHHAMEEYWQPGGAPYQEAPRWAMWCLFTGEYRLNDAMGIMFDDIGQAQRQGAAIFLQAFNVYEATYLSGDPNIASARRRRQFFSCVHEIGHGLNLAHSWEKTAEAPWRWLRDDPQARSFMNYPESVDGGQEAFFRTFPYKFLDEELLFLRHAPEEYVKPGMAPWFDDHGCRLDEFAPLRDDLALRLATGRPGDEYEFLEPVLLQVELLNRADVAGREPRALWLDPGSLTSGDRLTLVVKRDGSPARLFRPFARRRFLPWRLNPGESAFDSLFVNAGAHGWFVGEPGGYTVQACLHIEGGNVLSAPLRFRVAAGCPARQRLAADWFQPAVGLALALGSARSPGLAAARAVLTRAADELPDSKLALHARHALCADAGKEFKRLSAVRPAGRVERTAWRMDCLPGDPDRERREQRLILLDPRTPDAMGFAAYAQRVRRHARWLRQSLPAVESDEFLRRLRAEAERRGAQRLLDYLERFEGSPA